jgi:GntP family gluconate:H+ symporter
MILWGGFVALCMTLSGWLWATVVMPRYMPVYIPPEPSLSKEPGAPPVADAVSMPGFFAAIAPLLVPLLLILADTTGRMLLPADNPLRSVLSIIGNANVAVFLGAACALALLHRKLRAAGKPRLAAIDGALKSAGPIIFITAAGGSLGAVLEKSGAGQSIAEFFANSGLPFLLIPFGITGLLKTIQGSGTIAVVTAATLCLPIAQRLELDPLLIALSSGAGARLICHVNDSFFWVYANMGGVDTRTALKTLSASNVAMALGGLAATWVVSLVIN